MLREGKDAAIVTFGTTISLAERAANILAIKGINVEIVNARFIKPMDEEMLHRLMQSGKPILTIEEAMLEGGFGSAVLEFANDHSYSTDMIDRMGIPDTFVEHGSVDLLLRDLHITDEEAAKKIENLIAKNSKKQAGLKA